MTQTKVYTDYIFCYTENYIGLEQSFAISEITYIL